jgi:hypothetical protein
MKNKKKRTVERVPKSNRKTTERGKIDAVTQLRHFNEKVAVVLN